MLLTITTTHRPATDLGYLLHKNPQRAHEVKLPFGTARMFYPEATEQRCSATLLLDVDPIGLVRGTGRNRSGDSLLTQYVNDRPYAASSLLSVAIGRVYGTALSGRSKERPDLADIEIPLGARLTPLPCHDGEALLRRLFEPLGYTVDAERHLLDEANPDWGESRYFTVTLEGRLRLSQLLRHLNVLIPVLDNEKHYWVGTDEVEKLVRRGKGWLDDHPEKELIATRYMKHFKRLAREALARLSDEDQPDPELTQKEHGDAEAALERPIRLNDLRLEAVARALREQGARRVLDLGCGEGRLLKILLKDRQFEEIVGLDASVRALEIAKDRLDLDQLPPRQRARIHLLQGALTYRDRRLEGFDAATLIEVIEHLNLTRLSALERVLFEFARPGTVIVTTPNREFNVAFENLAAGALRHRDHRFEWTREEFEDWADRVARAHGYRVDYVPIGKEDPNLGPPTQMAVFARCA
ncbi:MAG: 3' terminal RNA ribose 2'-O-methyltransferase Hen1 [Alphaproteobacteria bacterium]